ncbi:MAG: hypothetical protein B7Y84_12065 [Azorhizobium sp. 32-67-21]|nr:MAG: hypothetical protein B7Y84_12065 [Azorhizobium sp. 32-67-21]
MRARDKQQDEGAGRAAQLQRALDCDVCIVGATLAGLATALSLALRGRSVVVLEAGTIGPYRGSGLVRAGFGRSAAELCAAGGRDDVRAIYDLSAAGARSARRLMAVLDIPADALGLIILPGPNGRRDLLDEAAARDLLGLDELLRLSPENLRADLALDAPFGALLDRQPQAFAAADVPLRLAEAARAADVRIMERTRILGTDLDGVRKYVETVHGRIRADHVVLTTDRGVPTFAPWIGSALIDCPFVSGGFSSGTIRARAGETVVELGQRGALFSWQGSSLRFTAPTASFISRGPAAACALRRHARRFYPGLRGALADDAHGVATRTSRHRLPLLGSYRPGVWYGIGLGAEPLSDASLVADMIGDAIVERDDSIRRFSPFGPLPAFGWVGRVVRRAAYWGGRVSDASARAEALRELPSSAPAAGERHA